jgi:hypothetical protein
MIPLPLILGIRKAVICHGASIWCWKCGWKQRSDRNYWQIHGKWKSSFVLSTFLRGSSTNSTGCLMFPCLKEWNKTAFDVWFYVLMTTTSKSMVFFDHQNKCRHALRVELSSLCMGDSNFNHVLMHSPTVPRLAGIHQHTIALHSLPKRGVVVWRLGMWGIGILMRPESILHHDRHLLHKPDLRDV